ncbi:hypothetical protein FHS83_001837 [Rhizomicrobium palustre]|uniref:VOC domain-containing protein n=1 Tax=Rhizomicrobium palustre TaxID=189966 RepID=A0A846MZ41_9PROT|nr:VOC family protein [Rhizomicrobium palustre]NIK88519.1 hypothetical protein [Rhizomicrobium palustre]
MANPFVHVELNTTDLAKAKAFYGTLFRWELTDLDMGAHGRYTLIGVGEGTGGGMMQHPVPGAPSQWLPYAEVPDLAAATEKARELGAKIVQANVLIEDKGAFSLIIDPTGAMIGLWQPHRRRHSSVY